MLVIYRTFNRDNEEWPLNEQDWEKLAEAGWNVHWVQPTPLAVNLWSASYLDTYANPLRIQEKFDDPDANFYGAKAISCAKEFDDYVDPFTAIEEWSNITGKSANALGKVLNNVLPLHSFEIKEANKPKVRTDVNIDTGELILW